MATTRDTDLRRSSTFLFSRLVRKGKSEGACRKLERAFVHGSLAIPDQLAASALDPAHDPVRHRREIEAAGQDRLQGPALRRDTHRAGGLLVSALPAELPRHRGAVPGAWRRGRSQHPEPLGSGKRILAVQGQGSDRAFDDVGVDLDPVVVEEQAQASPARQSVADRIGEFALAADQAELLAQPRLQRLDHGPASLLTHGTPLVGRATTDLGFDPIECGDARQRFCGNRRGGVKFVEEPPCVAPAIGQPDRAALGQHLVGRIAIDLQHAFEPSQMRDRPAGGAVGGVDVGDTGWIGSAPGPVVTGVGPELTGLGAPAPGIEHGGRGLVGKQLVRALQRLQQPLVYRPEQEGGASDPIGELRTVEDDTLAGEDLRLAIERQVVGRFGDEHLRD